MQKTIPIYLAAAFFIVGCDESSERTTRQEAPPAIPADVQSTHDAGVKAASKAIERQVVIMEEVKRQPQPATGTPGTMTVTTDLNDLDEQIKRGGS